MSIFVGVIIGLFMLVFLVTAHEYGHFLMARKNGVEVEEFGICFPPRALCWRKVDGKWRRIKKSEWKKMPGDGLIISLNWLPIGGFCQMKGESAADKSKGSFGRASFWRKTKILFGGVAMNWLVAFIILTVLAFTGMPHFLENQFTIAGDTEVVPIGEVSVASVLEDSPAEKAGFVEGDVLRRAKYYDIDKDGLSADLDLEAIEKYSPAESLDIYTANDFIAKNKEHAGDEVLVEFERDGQAESAVVKLNDADAEYLFGASIGGGAALYKNTWSAPIVGAGTTLQITGETFKGIGKLLVSLVSGVAKQVNFNENVRQEGAGELKTAADSMSGPVGIIGVLFPAFTSSGAPYLFYLVAIISISLACMNVLPIPALDGGRWLLITIFKLRKKKLTQEKESKIVGRAFAAILLLSLVITVIDIIRVASMGKG